MNTSLQPRLLSKGIPENPFKGTGVVGGPIASYRISSKSFASSEALIRLRLGHRSLGVAVQAFLLASVHFSASSSRLGL